MMPRSADAEAAPHAKSSTADLMCTLAAMRACFSRRTSVSTSLRRVWLRLQAVHAVLALLWLFAYQAWRRTAPHGSLHCVRRSRMGVVVSPVLLMSWQQWRCAHRPSCFSGPSMPPVSKLRSRSWLKSMLHHHPNSLSAFSRTSCWWTFGGSSAGLATM